MSTQSIQLLRQLQTPLTGEELFDHLSDIVYFIKDAHCRYLVVNRTLVERCRVKSKEEILGKTAVEALGPSLGGRFEAQDRNVIATGKPIVSQLELHLHRSGDIGWCLTTKLPLKDRNGAVIGLMGASQDLRIPNLEAEEYVQLATALEGVERNLSGTESVEEIARAANLSRYQLDRRMKTVFGLSAGQWLVKLRINAAQQLLRETNTSIARVAGEVGYSDQSAFARQFRASTGLTPREFRLEHFALQAND